MIKKLTEFVKSELIKKDTNRTNIFTTVYADFSKKIIEEITNAYIDDNIYYVYQFLIDNNKNIVAAESLLRYKYKGEFIPPFVLYYILDSAKLPYKFEILMLHKLCEDLQKFKQKLGNDFYVTHNFEPHWINEKALNYIKKITEQYGLSPSSIGIEILETESNSKINKECLEKFKQLGCKVLIDDFGSGYNNENTLKRIDCDVIKLDGKFAKNISKSKVQKEMVKIINYAKTKNIKVLAEVVESNTIAKFLYGIGVDYIQGYCYSIPKPINESIKEIKYFNKNNSLER